MSRLKVLVSAYACEPGKGSEPGVGWNQVNQIARFHEAWVLTRENNRNSIERALALEPLDHVHWCFLDAPAWMRFWKKGRRGSHLYYLLWQIGAFAKARKLHREVGFDVVHHVTFVNYWLPTFLPLLRVPFVWGPVGGGESMPGGFRSPLSIRAKIYEALRDCARRLGAMNPLVRMAARRASAAFATTAATGERLRELGCHSTAICPAVRLPADEIRALSALPFRRNHRFRVLSLGYLVHFKGFDLGLQAFARFRESFPQSEYWVIGDGPERHRLELLARRIGLNGAVHFWGDLQREQVFSMFADCDTLLFPSLHDSGGYASLEAMAAARPVICMDVGGPALQVTGETGFKIRAISPAQAVEDMAAALTALAANPSLREEMGRAARRRVRDSYCWESHAEFIRGVYARALLRNRCTA